jgi:hypothetical protein
MTDDTRIGTPSKSPAGGQHNRPLGGDASAGPHAVAALAVDINRRHVHINRSRVA